MPGKTSVDGWYARFVGWLDPDSEPMENNKGCKEYRGFCPIHEDPTTSKTPSASYNFDENVFKCFGKCDKGMTIGTLWSLYKEDIEQGAPVSNVRSITSAKSVRSNGKTERLPTEDDVKAYRKALRASAKARTKLMEMRGLTEDTIEDYELGWDTQSGRYTIPIRDAGGDLVNIRKYKPGVRVGKVVSFNPGSGSNALYGVDALQDNEVVFCEGEMDMLIARQFGFNSITMTAGAGSWRPEWAELFEGKVVYLVFDNDSAGIKGSRKVAISLRRHGVDVRVVKLTVPDGQDLTDFFVGQGYAASDLSNLMAQTPMYEHRSLSPQAKREEALPVTLLETQNADLVNKPLSFVGTIAGKQASPYAFPKSTVATCEMDWGPKCKDCPMNDVHGGQATFATHSDDRVLLRMVGKAEEQRRKDFLAAQAIPPGCPNVELDEQEHWAVEQLVVVPSIDDMDTSANIRREVFNVGSHKTPVNATVRFEGLNTDDPRSGTMVMQTWECEETKTSLDTFTMSPALMKELNVFQPAEGQGVPEKLWEIAEDIGANVTHIYGRPEMHIAYDLVWHSLLDFRFRGAYMGKGWLELLVVGDTRTGKSEAASRLTGHYQAGTLTSCEGATLAGLVGGAQQVNNNWVITWGTIPLHDRRLVVLDEVSGLKDKGVLESMSEVRSSGRAKVVKIVSQETNARTRLIWISNPADGRAISEMPRGAIDAIQDLIPAPEDIARFDMAMVAAKADVKSSVINAAKPPKVEHVYTTDLCSQLVLWAWSRGKDDVKWEIGAQRLALVLAEKIGQQYVPDPPLLQAENARVKLARMAVAIAARLFSHDGTGQKVLVTKEHVRTARRFLDKLYRMPRFGYASYSRQVLEEQAIAEENAGHCIAYLRENTGVLEALRASLLDSQFRMRDFAEFGGLDQELAAHAVGRLMRMRMVRRVSKGYIRMQPQLISIVRQMDRRERRRPL